MFRFTQEPSSGNHDQCLAKITRLVQLCVLTVLGRHATITLTTAVPTQHLTLALPVLLYGSETWTIKASDARRITAAELKYIRRTATYT